MPRDSIVKPGQTSTYITKDLSSSVIVLLHINGGFMVTYHRVGGKHVFVQEDVVWEKVVRRCSGTSAPDSILHNVSKGQTPKKMFAARARDNLCQEVEKEGIPTNDAKVE